MKHSRLATERRKQSATPTADAAMDEAIVTAVLEEWRRRMRISDNGAARSGERGARERALVRALLLQANDKATDFVAASTGPLPDGADERIEALALAAALYGANMPRERLDPYTLCEDLGTLRVVVWDKLREQKLSPAEQTDRILRFDRALSIALRAALTGGYRLTPPDDQVLSETLEEVLTDCSRRRATPPKGVATAETHRVARKRSS